MYIDLRDNYILGIPPYVFWMGIGFIFAFSFFIYLLYLEDIKIDKQIWLILFGIVGVVVGARIFGAIKNLFLALYNHEEISINIIKKSGLVYYGGLLGFLLVVTITMICIYHTYDKTLMNCIAIVVPLFHSCGRVGCLFAGCCYGKEWDHFFSVHYIMDSDNIRKCFPTQIVEAGIEIFLFGLLFVLHKKNKNINLLKTYLIMYAIGRFGMEYARGDDIRGLFGNFSFSQYISMAILSVVILSTIFQKMRRTKNEVA